MERIVLPMKVHAVKLEYRRQLLETMPHGYFRVRKGQYCVIVTRDPEDPNVCPKRPRTYRISTKRGRKFSIAVNNYLRIKSEYDTLLHSWNSTYRFAPPGVKFPIKQFYDPHMMNNDYFKKQAEHCGNYKADKPTYSEDGELKSKNELMGASLLKQMGIPVKYETEVYIEETNETINPDFLADFYEIDRCSYVELLGMSDKFDYAARTSAKINSFSRGKYRPGREVIYVLLYDRHNFDGVYFVEQVLSAFDTMIPDSALEWGENADFSAVNSSYVHFDHPDLENREVPAC